MSDLVLALNAGSSTLKYTLYRFDDAGERELLAETLRVTDAGRPTLLDAVLERVRSEVGSEAFDVGHRIVHGGSTFTAPVQVDGTVVARLQQLVPLAPLHLPPALQLLRHALDTCPRSLHVACFDTAFHQSLPAVARRFALPDDLYERGVRRYGFHGLSYEYVLSTFGSRPPARLVVAHLGSGASMAALRGGESIDTSMGLTPCGGIPMGSRSGDLDPGVLIHLMREHHYTVESLEDLLNHGSGLKGLAGTAEMSELLSRAGNVDTNALAAVELFAYSIKKQLGAYFAVLGGLDCLVFTGGIGEHAPLVRSLACSDLTPLGIELDPQLNAKNAPRIGRAGTSCDVRIVRTDEDLVIARATHAMARGLRV
jgi:acetate kinase